MQQLSQQLMYHYLNIDYKNTGIWICTKAWCLILFLWFYVTYISINLIIINALSDVRYVYMKN